jgi:hypothetical protein
MIEKRPIITISGDEAAGMAIRVEDVMKIMNNLLDGAEVNANPHDWKRKTLIVMARERNSHLEWVIQRLRGEVPPFCYTNLPSDGQTSSTVA